MCQALCWFLGLEQRTKQHLCSERGHRLAGETDIEEINMQTNTWPQISTNVLKGNPGIHEHERYKKRDWGERAGRAGSDISEGLED